MLGMGVAGNNRHSSNKVYVGGTNTRGGAKVCVSVCHGKMHASAVGSGVQTSRQLGMSSRGSVSNMTKGMNQIRPGVRHVW